MQAKKLKNKWSELNRLHQMRQAGDWSEQLIKELIDLCVVFENKINDLELKASKREP